MSLRNAILPDMVLADLYPDSLVQPEEKRSAVTAVNESGQGIANYRYLGKNQKSIAILVNYQDEVHIPEPDLQFLTKILAACNLKLTDVAVINHGEDKVNINKLKEELHPAKVLLFGVEPTAIELPLSFPLLRPQEYGGISFLTIPVVSSLTDSTEDSQALKKQLWDCLKKMFVV